MNDLATVYKFVAAASGATEIKLRSGKYSISGAPITHLVPYVATYANTMSRIMFALECISFTVEEGSSPVKFSQYGGVLSPSVLAAILLNTFENMTHEGVLDLREVEDQAILTTGQENLTPTVNEMLRGFYDEYVCKDLARDLEQTLEKLVAAEKGNEVTLNAR